MEPESKVDDTVTLAAGSERAQDIMKSGIVFASTTFPEPGRAIAMVQAAEEVGFESLWCPEQGVVAVGAGATPYGGSLDGKMDRLWKRGGIPDEVISPTRDL